MSVDALKSKECTRQDKEKDLTKSKTKNVTHIFSNSL